MASSEYMNCELYLAQDDQARLTVSGRDYSGRPALGGPLRSRLLQASLDPNRYGSLLFEGLFPGDGGELLEGYRAGLAIARNQQKRLRFRLHIAPSANSKLHDLHWEFLYDPREKLALARSQDTAFSRYLSVPLEPGTAMVEKAKLLVVASQPTNLEEYRLSKIDARQVHLGVEKALGPFADVTSYEFLEGPATVGRIRDRLHKGGFHVLHLQAHGLVHPEGATASLVLEDEDRCASIVSEDLFSEMVEGNRKLRLVTLIACHSAAHSRADPFSGLGSALVRRGVPAVVAMRRAIRLETASRFTKHLYVNLARDGSIDTAVNEARLQLYLRDPERLEWGAPTLFMRLPEGRLWASAAARKPEVREYEGDETETPFGSEVNERRWKPSYLMLAGRAGFAVVLLLVGLMALLWIQQEIKKPQSAPIRFDFSVHHDGIHEAFRQKILNRGYEIRLHRGLQPADSEAWGVFQLPPSLGQQTSILPPGYYFFDQERADVAILPRAFQVGEETAESLEVEIRILGSDLVIHFGKDFLDPVFLSGHGITFEVPPGAKETNVRYVDGIPSGEYMIFNHENERYKSLRKRFDVIGNSGRYEIDFLPEENILTRKWKPSFAAESPRAVSVKPTTEETPAKLPEPLFPGRSEANYNMLVRSVKIACQSSSEESALEPVLKVLQEAIDGVGKMPVLPERRTLLEELLLSAKASGCEGFAVWVRDQSEEGE